MSTRCLVNCRKQHGIALVIFVVVLVISSIAFMLGSVSVEQLRSQEANATQTSLSRAKQALLDFALTYEDSNPGEYGFLPCPDTGAGPIPEGGSHSVCGAAKENTMGLFPWASLETGVLRSGSGECLWYVLSGEYKFAAATKTEMLNEDTNGAIRLYHYNGNIKHGATAEDRIVALIIDPSNVMPGQARNFDNTSLCGLDYASSGYLEGDGVYDNSVLAGGALTFDEFIERGVKTDELAAPYNDQIVAITRDELWGALLSRRDFVNDADSAIRRLTEALALCIAAYGNNSGNRKLPRPAPIDFLGADYRMDANYNDTAAVTHLGRYPHTVADSDTALGAAYAPNDSEPVLFDKGYCNALAVAGGPPINLNTASGAEGYTLWKNWKDHVFYVVSAYYAPAGSADSGAPSCDGTNCVISGGNEYAAVVLYSGSRTGAQVRNEPIAGDTDTKNLLANYIEVNNPVGNGTGDYTPTGNDIAFCITDTDPLTVVGCP